MLLLALLYLVSGCYATIPFNLTPISSKAGLYYHQIGVAKLSNDKFTLLTYTNISNLNLQLGFVKQFFDKSLTLCKHPQPKANQTFKRYVFTCKEDLELINVQLNQLDYKFESICHLTGHNLKDLRNKRGIFDGASYAFKWLFGVPDAEDAKHYAEAIEAITQQTRDVQLLIKQQIHILSDAIQEQNKSVLTMRANEKKLNDNIVKFNTFSSNVTKQINALTYFQKVQDHLNLITQIITGLNEQFDVIISSILFAKKNILHPSIITPKHLQEELSKIKLNAGQDFPISPDDNENIYQYFSICEIAVIYINKILIYALRIPLVTKELFQLYNIIPLPIIVKDTSSIYSYIDPSYPYLLISTTRTYYAQTRNLDNCKRLLHDDYICQHTIQHLTKEQPVCETELRLKNLDNIPEDCKTKTIKAELEIWHPLSTNQWLYIISKPTTASITCYDSTIPTDTELAGIGIFTMSNKCKCYTYTTLLISTSNQTTNYTNYIPNVDLTDDECCIEKQEYLEQQTMEKVKLSNINLNELQAAHHKLQQFDDLLEDNLKQPIYSSHFKWYNLALGIITTLVLALCCCRCLPCRKLSKWLRSDSCSSSHSSCCPPICITNKIQTREYDVQMSSLRHSGSQLSLEAAPSSTPLSKRRVRV